MKFYREKGDFVVIWGPPRGKKIQRWPRGITNARERIFERAAQVSPDQEDPSC